ncbi:MAG TPA: hypothetical protein VFQ61_35805 [Polyangiaceae bacterium]|nr:hypothetical protein [Polyangiaceae bacterium]
MKPLSAGSEIDSYCTKCRMDLGHRVVAMVAGAPKRVVCLTCNSEHNYRAPRTLKSNNTKDLGVRSRSDRASVPPKAPSASGGGSGGVRAASKAKAESERYENWASRTLGQAVDAFTRYSMERTFRAGELVLHPKFGEGYVDQVLEGGKVNVMFREGAKVLAHRVS